MPRASLQLALLLAASVLPASCVRRDAAPGEDALRLRNRARLEAARDTREGLEAAARAFEALEREQGLSDIADELNAARCWILAGRFEEGRRRLARVRGRGPAGVEAPPEVSYLEGLAAKGLGDYRGAAARFREVTASEPGLAAPWYQLASALFLAQAHAEAVEAFDRVLVLEPEHVAAQYKRAMALRSLGSVEGAEKAMARFVELKRRLGESQPDEAALERCRFTRVKLAPPPGTAHDPPPSPIDFEDATAASGLEGESAASAALLDFDRDGDVDLYLARKGPDRLLRNDSGRFTDVTDLSEAADPGDGAGAEPADFNNDSIADLFVLNRNGPSTLYKGLGMGVFQALPECGIPRTGIQAARWADHDHDGDLDLLVIVSSGESEAGPRALRACRNNGDETFLAEDDVFPGEGAAWAGIAMVDLDRGNDIDFVVADSGGPARAFLNLRRGPFRAEAVEGLTRHPIVLAGDLDGDGELDLVGAPGEHAPLRLALSRGAAGPGKLPRFAIEEPPGGGDIGPASSLALADLDDDGDLDILLGGRAGVVFHRNRRGKLERSPLGGLVAGAELGVRALALIDAGGGGGLGILTCGEKGEVRLWRRKDRGDARAVTLRPIGTRDNRDAVGAHVEVFAGGFYQRRLIDGPGSSGGAGGIRLGLGSLEADALDGFQVLWPNGIEQPVFREECRWSARRALEVTQKRGLAASCPFLYVHDGRRWLFQTDVVGIAPLDEWLPEGVSPHLDPEEFVRIPGDRLGESSGRLRAAITEELREMTYLDRVSLLRVTHPEGTLVLHDESTRQGGMEPLRVWLVREGDVSPPPRALTDAGEDGAARLASADGDYLHPYPAAPPQWSGWSASHTLTLEPPAGFGPSGGLLLLTGRIFWPDSTVAFAVSQHGRSWAPPRLEAGAAGGAWRPVVEDIGFPCGMDRTLALSIGAGSIEPGESLRLVANHRFLWDRAAFAPGAAPVTLGDDGAVPAALGGEPIELVRETLPLAEAVLGWHGFSREVGDLERHEQVYDFETSKGSIVFESPAGRATRYGDVLRLLEAPDSLLVVLVPGDSVALEFEADPPPRDRRVTFFLQVTGWAKEGGFHNRTGRTVEPLPFHGMDDYPPVRAEPPDRSGYLEEYQTRRLGEP